MLSFVGRKWKKTPLTVGIKPQPWLKNAWRKMPLCACIENHVKGRFSDSHQGCRFETSGSLPVFTNRRLKCPVPLKHSLHSASSHLYLHVQVNRKSLLYTNQLLLNQYPANCNFVWGWASSAPDTSLTGPAALPQGLMSDNTPLGVAGKRKICYATGTIFTFLWSKICLIQKLRLACVSHLWLCWAHVRSNLSHCGLRRNQSTISTAMWSVAKVAVSTTRPLSRKIRVNRLKPDVTTPLVQITRVNPGTTMMIRRPRIRSNQLVRPAQQGQSTKRFSLTDYLYRPFALQAFPVTTTLRGELPC